MHLPWSAAGWFYFLFGKTVSLMLVLLVFQIIGNQTYAVFIFLTLLLYLLLNRILYGISWKERIRTVIASLD
ncbi:MAG: hypothetical protein EAZ32_12690 [Cytophagia bacterium]|nr:MAG: hypothetical protein EAZ38_13390 [Cytophagales bacterium]TAG38329.1 MAG: hypothetical protein EAZ32_12690 [Cytophagia bacterium]TAG79885.1 MAG: hypothetical protein EAZ22_10615 [Cytophagales bacterium]